MLEPGQPIFHGTKRRFKRFDSQYYDTGEHSVGLGFYFTVSAYGAANHAEHWLRSMEGEPLLYVCRLARNALILNAQAPIHTQTSEVQAKWASLPAVYAWAAEGPSERQARWFNNLFEGVAAKRLRAAIPPHQIERQKCQVLKDHGFDAIFDIEGGSADGYLNGETILVLNEAAVEIVEVLPTALVRPDLKFDMRWGLHPEPRPLPLSAIPSRLAPLTD